MPLPGPRAPIITDVSPPAGGQAILVGIGGVLAPSVRPAAATYWGSRLGMPPAAFLGALFGGSDDQVLTGRVSEPAGWDVVAGRLAAEPGAALFIDDTPGHVAAAGALGLTGHVHTSAGPPAQPVISTLGQLPPGSPGPGQVAGAVRNR